LAQRPFRVSRHLLTVRRLAGMTSWSFRTLQRHFGKAPSEPGCPAPIRFRSQAFSTSQRFPGNPEFTALFRAETVPGCIPSEASPRRDRVPLSGPLTVLQLSTDLLTLPTRRLITTGFPRRPRTRRSCLVPPTTMGFLSSGYPVSWSPWASMSCGVPFGQLHLLRGFLPPTSPFTTGLSFHIPVVGPLLDFCLFRASPLAPRSLEPTRDEPGYPQGRSPLV